MRRKRRKRRRRGIHERAARSNIRSESTHLYAGSLSSHQLFAEWKYCPCKQVATLCQARAAFFVTTNHSLSSVPPPPRVSAAAAARQVRHKCAIEYCLFRLVPILDLRLNNDLLFDLDYIVSRTAIDSTLSSMLATDDLPTLRGYRLFCLACPLGCTTVQRFVFSPCLFLVIIDTGCSITTTWK